MYVFLRRDELLAFIKSHKEHADIEECKKRFQKLERKYLRNNLICSRLLIPNYLMLKIFIEIQRPGIKGFQSE